MLETRQSKADLHVHSKHSDRPSEWFLRRIGAPECFVEPLRGLPAGAAAGDGFRHHLRPQLHPRGPGDRRICPARSSRSRSTTYFPEDGCKVHVLVLGISEEQFRMIQELRADIYQLQQYLLDEDILCSVSHPLYPRQRPADDRPRREAAADVSAVRGDQRGPRPPRRGPGRTPCSAILRRRLIDKDGRPARHRALRARSPGRRRFTGGSDDHSGVYIAHRPHGHAATPRTWPSSWPILRRGDHEAGRLLRRKRDDGAQPVPHRLPLLQGPLPSRRQAAASRRIIGELFKRLLEGPGERPQPAGFGQRLRGLATRLRLVAAGEQAQRYGTPAGRRFLPPVLRPSTSARRGFGRRWTTAARSASPARSATCWATASSAVSSNSPGRAS